MPVDYDLGTARGRIVIDSSQLGRASQAFRTFGLATTAAGVAAVAAFAYVVKSAADFEHQMSAVKAVSGASRKEMDLLSESALDLSSKTVFSAGEIGGAMEALAKAGIPVEDMLNGATEATITLAAAAGDELPGGVERAAEVIANAMKTFNAGADEMNHFADVLVGAAASSTLSVDDLATSMRYAGPIAAQLGLSIDDLSTVLAILGDRGIKGSTAGTSLRGVLLSLSPTSKKAENALRDLGLITEDGSNRFYDMQGNLKPIPEVMQLLQDATKGLSEEQKVQAFNTIFQRRAMNSALIMAELGAAGFDDYAEAIAGIDASDVAADKLDNLSGDITILRNAVDALVIKAGRPLQDMLRGWVQGVTDFVNVLSNLDPNLLALIVKIIGIAGVILIAIGAFSLFLSFAVRAYRTFVILKEAIGLVTAAAKLMAISFLTNPVFLLIAAIVALIAILYLAYIRSEEFREAFDKAFDKIQPAIEAAVGWVQNFVSYLDELWQAFQDGGIEGQAFADVLDKMGVNGESVVNALVWIRDALIWLKDAAITAFDYFADVVLPLLLRVGWAIIQGIGSAIDWFTGTAIPAIKEFGSVVADVAREVGAWLEEYVGPVLSAFGDLVKAVSDRIVQYVQFMLPIWAALGAGILAVLAFITTLFDDFVQAAITIWDYFGDNIIEAITLVWNFVVGIIQGALQTLQGIIQIITGIISLNWSMVWEGIKNVVGGVWATIWNLVSSGIQAVRLIIEQVLDVIVVWWKISWDLVSAVLAGVWNVIFGILQGAWDWIVNMWNGLLTWLGAVWNSAWENIKAVLVNAWNAIYNALVTAVGWVLAIFVALPGNILASIGDLLSTLYQKGVDLISGFMNGIIFIVGELVSYLMALPGNIVDWIGDLGETLYNAGVDLIQGFIDGIDNMIPSVGDVLGGLTDMIPDWKGPPERDRKLLIANGELIMQGFMRGLKNEFPAIQALMQGYTNQLGSDMAMTSMGGMFGHGNTDNSSIKIELTFNGVENEVQLRSALQSSGILNEITRAVQAGRR